MTDLNFLNITLGITGLLFLILFVIINQKYYWLIIFFVVLTPVIRALFSSNQPGWVNEELETGIPGYTRGLILLTGGIVGLTFLVRSILSKRFRISIPFFLLFLFIAHCISSTLYSINPSITFNRAILFLMIFLLTFGIFQKIKNVEDVNYILNTLFYSVLAVNLLSFFSLAIPARSWWWQSSSRFIGIFSEPNGMGSFFMLSYPFLLWKYYYNRSEKIFRYSIPVLITIIFSLQLLTGSRTSIITSIIGLSLWFFLIKKRTKLVIFGFIFTTLLLLILLINPPESIFRGDDSILTTTGRDAIWANSIIMILKNPWLGYGYMVESKIWDNQYQIVLEDWITVSSQQPLHNGYISIIAGNGLIGFVLWLIIITTPLYYSFKIKDNQFIYHRTLVIVITVMFLITNFFESFLTGYLTVGDTYFWFIWLISIKSKDLI